jgi:hypothetical protein
MEEPNIKFINKYKEEFDKNNKHSENLINCLISNYPENNKVEIVLLKVITINSLYSTNIYNGIKIAEHIKNISNFDNRIQEGDENLINDIAMGHGIKTKKKSKEYYFYSFATKYCSIHNNNCYPIYDNILSRLLKKYKEEKIVEDFNNSNLIIFSEYKKILTKLKNKYNLDNFSFRDIDKALWQYGKILSEQNSL